MKTRLIIFILLGIGITFIIKGSGSNSSEDLIQNVSGKAQIELPQIEPKTKPSLVFSAIEKETAPIQKERKFVTKPTILRSTSCTDNGGRWLEEHNECERIQAPWCEENGGEYEGCDSACRHKPSKVCTRQCIEVCRF